MSTDPRTGMTILDDTACWELAATAEIGRLAVAVGDDIEIFPVNPVVDGRTLVFRTGEGTKLAAVTISGRVAVELDGHDPATGDAWSVVVKGHARRLEHFADIARAEDLGVRPWSGHPAQWYVRVQPSEITGRRFRVTRADAE